MSEEKIQLLRWGKAGRGGASTQEAEEGFVQTVSHRVRGASTNDGCLMLENCQSLSIDIQGGQGFSG